MKENTRRTADNVPRGCEVGELMGPRVLLNQPLVTAITQARTRYRDSCTPLPKVIGMPDPPPPTPRPQSVMCCRKTIFVIGHGYEYHGLPSAEHPLGIEKPIGTPFVPDLEVAVLLRKAGA